MKEQPSKDGVVTHVASKRYAVTGGRLVGAAPALKDPCAFFPHIVNLDVPVRNVPKIDERRTID